MRSSLVGWLRLRHLLTMMERCAETCARLDAYRQPRRAEAAAIDLALDRLERRIDTEMTRLTVERLEADLAAKKAKRVA